MLNHLEGLKRKSRAGDRSERKSQTEGFGKADFRRVFLRYCENRFTVVGLQHFGGSSDIRCMIEFMQMRSFILMCSMQVAGHQKSPKVTKRPLKGNKYNLLTMFYSLFLSKR